MKEFQEKLLFSTIPSLVTVLAQRLIQRPQPKVLKLSQSLLSPKIFEFVWPVILLISGVLLANLTPGIAFNMLLANIILNIGFVVSSRLGNLFMSRLFLTGMVITLIGFLIVNKNTSLNWWLVPYVLFLLILVLIMTILKRLQIFVDQKFGRDNLMSKFLDYLGKLED